MSQSSESRCERCPAHLPRRTSDEQLRGERFLRITQLLKQRGGWYQRPARTGPTPLHFLWLPYPAGRDAPNVAGCSSLPSPSAQIFGCATIRHHFGGIEVTDVALPNRRGDWQFGHAVHTLAGHQVELRAAELTHLTGIWEVPLVRHLRCCVIRSVTWTCTKSCPSPKTAKSVSRSSWQQMARQSDDCL